MNSRRLCLIAICAALTGCASSHGSAASTPFPPQQQQQQPQVRHGVRPPLPDPLRETWERRGYTTVLSDDGRTLYLSGRPGTVRIARSSKGLQWFTAMSCTAGLVYGNALYAACGGHVLKLNASTGETMQRSAPISFAVTALAPAGARAIAVNPEESGTSAATTPLFLDRDTLKPWNPRFK